MADNATKKQNNEMLINFSLFLIFLLIYTHICMYILYYYYFHLILNEKKMSFKSALSFENSKCICIHTHMYILIHIFKSIIVLIDSFTVHCMRIGPSSLSNKYIS